VCVCVSFSVLRKGEWDLMMIYLMWDTMIESWGWIQGNQSINPYCFVSGFFLFFFIIWGNLCHYITFFFYEL
jgi:hypothetical protein